MIRASLLALALLLPAPLAAEDAVAPTLEEQLDLWLEWFPGRYDSYAQTQAQAQAELSEEERNYRRHSVFRRVELPTIGPITFYAEQRRWLEGAPPEGEVYRQRIYEITLDDERQAIRLRVHVPKDQPSLLGAHADPSKLEGLTREDFVVWPGCDLFWSLEGHRFFGRLDPGACRFYSDAYGQEIQLEEYLMLAPDQMHFADRGLSMAGEYLFGMRGDTPTTAFRARAFECEVGDASSKGGHQRIVTHNMGGMFEIDGKGAGGAPIRARLWTWSARLRLELLDAGSDKIMASAASPARSSLVELTAENVSIACRFAPDGIYLAD